MCRPRGFHSRSPRFSIWRFGYVAVPGSSWPAHQSRLASRRASLHQQERRREAGGNLTHSGIGETAGSAASIPESTGTADGLINLFDGLKTAHARSGVR
jgi:hypothetical protein